MRRTCFVLQAIFQRNPIRFLKPIFFSGRRRVVGLRKS
ncbi:hypothetical protein LEP1GSC193_3693 [Leptospira alstonii serovar Pingchang str. 80-412]|uniref:Uncharacterized protein n=1 Tax=Leptospira alstonii serovar Pingchang str. 80-412 TaxID=1218564 RepID=T0H6U4_9LEPT|nr:hypothetical protein LEP1GSC193_3693 [Leptospira alstonii serovar Pingchang str. 80-412]